MLEYLEPPSSTTNAAEPTSPQTAGKDELPGVGNPAEKQPAEPAIQCMESSADEVPTIHIVDTLENSEAVVKGAFQSLDQAEMKSIEELVNNTADGKRPDSAEDGRQREDKDKEPEKQPAEEERKTQDDGLLGFLIIPRWPLHRLLGAVAGYRSFVDRTF